MLSKFELNVTDTHNRARVVKAAAALGIVALLVIVSSMFLNNVIATPVSPREAEIRGWVNALRDANLTTDRQQAQSNLEKAGAEAVPALTAALRSNDPVVRRNAADMLGFIAAPSASAALQEALSRDPVPEVRVNAAAALGAIGSAASLNALQNAGVLDTSATVRQAANNAATSARNALAKSAGQDPNAVQAVTVAPGQSDTVYLASSRDLLISRNGGGQWTTLPQALPSMVSTLAVNPTNPDIVYAGMQSLGMYLSADGGRTWQSLTRNFSNEAIGSSTVTAIAVDPSNPTRVVMAHGIRIGDAGATFFPLGILSSKDGGKSWANVTDLSEGQLVTQMSIKDNKVYALTGDKVLIAALP